MLPIIGKMVRGIRTEGFGWLLKTARNEVANPRRPLTYAIRRLIVLSHDLLTALRRALAPPPSPTHDADMLQFFFDLDACPVTFDVASYLAGAELVRRRHGLSGIQVIVVPGRAEGLRREDPAYAAAVDRDARLWRLHNIVLPVLDLLPSVQRHVLCANRAEAEALMAADPRRIYPEGYRTYLPRQPEERVVRDLARTGMEVWPLLRATPQARRFIAGFLDSRAGNRDAVVITLRQCAYMPARNSRIQAWLDFADRLDPERFVPVFVPDTEAALRQTADDFRGHIVCEAAAWDVDLRLALYEAAYLNLAVMHGPMELCWYSDRCRYILFMTVGTAPQNSEAALRQQGHEIGASLPFASRWQRLVWAFDELPLIRREFARMVGLIDASP